MPDIELVQVRYPHDIPDIVVIDVLNSKSVDAILSMIDGKLSGISH